MLGNPSSEWRHCAKVFNIALKVIVTSTQTMIFETIFSESGDTVVDLTRI